MATDAFWSKDDALRYWLKALELATERHTCEMLHESCTLRVGGACAREVRAVLAAREEEAA